MVLTLDDDMKSNGTFASYHGGQATAIGLAETFAFDQKFKFCNSPTISQDETE